MSWGSVGNDLASESEALPLRSPPCRPRTRRTRPSRTPVKARADRRVKATCRSRGSIFLVDSRSMSCMARGRMRAAFSAVPGGAGTLLYSCRDWKSASSVILGRVAPAAPMISRGVEVPSAAASVECGRTLPRCCLFTLARTWRRQKVVSKMPAHRIRVANLPKYTREKAVRALLEALEIPFAAVKKAPDWAHAFVSFDVSLGETLRRRSHPISPLFRSKRQRTRRSQSSRATSCARTR